MFICVTRTKVSQDELKKLLTAALGYSYDKKYCDRDYSNDVRGFTNQWIIEFNNILNVLNININVAKVIVVGIGNGHEGSYLYKDITDLQIIDIAPESLACAKKILPRATAYNVNAQELSPIENASRDCYVSLMTYQSSYFDIDKALREAFRVLKINGSIVLSISCGYMKDNNIYIDGMASHNGAVDRNKPYNIIEKIRKRMITLNFSFIGVRSTPSEIFIYGKKG